jgi:hypothetical protein
MMRVLRLSAAAGCFLACIGLAALWVRSLSWSDWTWSSNPYASLSTERGKICINFTGNPLTNPIDFGELWQRRKSDPLYNHPVYGDLVGPDPPWWEAKSFLGFACFEAQPGRTWIHFPLWAPLLLCALGGIAFARNWKPRFSIRALLVTTTLVAAFLLGIKWRAQ